jgi:hypothetical protein
MEIIQLLKLFKKPAFILSIILVIFFLKGVFLAELFPIFTGQDEPRHYNTIQYLAESKEKTWEIAPREVSFKQQEDIGDYNFSQEIIGAGIAADYDVFRHSLYNTADFSGNYDGKNEAQINSRPWKAYNFYSPVDRASESLYHIFSAQIEKFFSGSSILVRFYLIRIFSVALGTLAIWLAYLIFKNSGFEPKTSLILTSIIAFQPRLAIYFSSINYDALLIPVFFLFTLGGVLSLKDGFNRKNFLLMAVATIVGFFTKGTALVLIPILILLIFYHSFRKNRIKIKPILLLIALVFFTIFFFKYNYLNLIPHKSTFPETWVSLKSYLSESLTMGHFALSSRTYWGTLSWNDNDWINDKFASIVWYAQAFSALGLIIFLISRKRPDFFPEKKFIVFFLIMLAALQLGIRLFDWKYYIDSGWLELGTPGRYFLPNIASHMALVFTGIGTIFYKIRLGKLFEPFMLLALFLMLSLSFYLIFNVIIYRYYL